MSNVTVSSYAEPIPQQALNGELGLTSEQIAASLGIAHSHCVRKIGQFSERLQISIRTRLEDSAHGRKKTVYILPSLLAKMVVARYENEIGFGYLRFLLDCERVATEVTPKLYAQVKELQDRLDNLLASQQAYKPKRLAGAKKGMLAIPVEQATLFGDAPVIHYVMMQMDSVSEAAKHKGQLRHLQKQMSGMANKINALQDLLDGRPVAKKKTTRK